MASIVARPTRRTFLKAGFFGTLALMAAGSIYRIARPESPPGFVMHPQARSALSAIAPVMLGNAIAETPVDIDKAVSLVDDAISGLPLRTQQEIQNLFALLTLGPSRRFLVGIPDDWPRAKPEDIAAFLQDWRHSRFALMQSAYHALHDLIIGPWYADASSWASVGYPGPLKELS
ncbi:hypothetical protein [Noviherbaspirillum saxi]|uniref:Twin-arginine translocation pathway signal protein n=1 Tax=Noviherbaspirillum saxi TaxID=2320863 RepID=A0A3A3FXB6_9BURK|nr:hypothetical protein [Noviherbaspirillum saxi]RJF98831.1 hypothetical protein D3871_10115 [Noviherbaspirillum saxi]